MPIADGWLCTVVFAPFWPLSTRLCVFEFTGSLVDECELSRIVE